MTAPHPFKQLTNDWSLYGRLILTAFILVATKITLKVMRYLNDRKNEELNSKSRYTHCEDRHCVRCRSKNLTIVESDSSEDGGYKSSELHPDAFYSNDSKRQPTVLYYVGIPPGLTVVDESNYQSDVEILCKCYNEISQECHRALTLDKAKWKFNETAEGSWKVFYLFNQGSKVRFLRLDLAQKNKAVRI